MNKIQVVILCAGRGSRLAPITDSIPKVLIEINEKTLLEHKLDILKDIASEVILVVGYQSEKIKNRIGIIYKDINIKYVNQEEQLGTGHAIMLTKNLLKNKFLVLNGDDIYSKEDLDNLIKNDLGILASEVENPSSFGILESENEVLKSIIEKPINPPSNLANMGVYLFNDTIFEHTLEKSQRDEYEIIDYLNYLISKDNKINVTKANLWLPVNNLEELKIAREVYEKCAE